MTEEEIVENWESNWYPNGLHEIPKQQLIDLITTYGLQKQNEVLDKVEEVIKGIRTPFGVCSCGIITPILNLKNKL